ncbi:MAG: hypothetical protein QNK31_12155 [Porticoccus sp.]|nr:hypothetical protein [Porticoccus sp.]
MTIAFETLALKQRMKMVYMLLAYLFSGAVALVIMRYLPELIGVFVGVFVAFGLGWVLTNVVNYCVKLHCPNCVKGQLSENYTLPCRTPEYRCSSCQRTYKEGGIV